MTAMRAVRAWIRSVRTEIMVTPVARLRASGTDDGAGLHHRHADDGLRRGAGVETGHRGAGGDVETVDVGGEVVGHPERAVADEIEAAPVARPGSRVGLHEGAGGVEPCD